MITIERITAERPFDTQQINALVQRLAEDRNAVRKVMSDQDIFALVSNPNYHLLVARDGERYVGLTSVIFEPDLGRWLCNMYNLVVAKGYRNQGVGDLLREAVRATLKKFSKDEQTVIHAYFTTVSPYIKDSAVQAQHGCVLIAEAVGPMGTNLCKVIIRPED